MHTNIKNVLKILPRKYYNLFSYILLVLYMLIGIVFIAVATEFDLKATLKCKPNQTLESNLSTRKYIETQCLSKYAEKFHPPLPTYVVIILNFVLLLLLNVLYSWCVKGRVEIFEEIKTTNGAVTVEDEDHPLSPNPRISPAVSNPMTHVRFGRFSVFKIYILHLIFCRIIPLAVFATVLLTSMDFPEQYPCPLRIQSTSAPPTNLLQKQITSRFLAVDCTYPMGGKKEILAVAVVTTNFLTVTLAFMELVCLLWSSWKDHNLLTDLEFCSVYLLRKRKRIRELIKKIRENMSDGIFELHDDFGEERVSRRKLEEMYINVIILEGREIFSTSRKSFENRQEIYEAHFKLPPDSVTIPSAQELFKPISGQQPRAILVVGRPGIGKTQLTKKLLLEWKRENPELWHYEMVMIIRFCEFNKTKGRTSLREMLQLGFGFNMSLMDFNLIYEYICLVPNKVVLIFDGLDELKVDHKALTEEIAIKSHSEVAHVLQIYGQLVKGELLPGITVLTTTRPTAEHIYQNLEFDREVEVIGFHEPQIKNFVEKFCRDEHKSSQIWDFIKQSPELLGLCYIPSNCYIVCLTLKEMIEAEGETNAPKTITELYKRAINILLFKHHREYRDKPTPKNYIIAKLPELLQNDLNELKKIARNGMIENKLIFECDDDDDDVAKLSDCGLFNKLEDKRRNVFCFLHLTIQEFLAALHVVDDMNKVESFLSEYINNPQWHLVIQFVCGLIGDKMRELQTERNKVERLTKIQNAEKRLEELRKNERIINSLCGSKTPPAMTLTSLTDAQNGVQNTK